MVTGQLAALAGGPAGSALHFMLSGKRRRKIVLAAVVIVTAAFMAAVTMVIQQPMYIADVVTHRLFGSGDSGGPKWEDKPAPDICVPPPSTAIPVTPPSTYVPEADANPEEEPTNETAPESTPPAPPPSALGSNGKVIEAARKIMDAVPAHSDMTVAQGFILYRLAHPDSRFPDDWNEWVTTFYDATSTLSAGASALDVVSTMDPNADYRPYLLVSDAATYRLLRNHKVSADARRIAGLLGSLMQTCQDGSGESPGTPYTSGVPAPTPDTPEQASRNSETGNPSVG
jgi:hypothetical protein